MRFGGRMLVAGALAGVLLAPACTFRGAFREDRRVEILAPRNRATVGLPVEVRWRVQDFTVTGPDGRRRDDAGYFALFVDRTPMAPGKNLRALAADDEPCLRTPGCPDEAWLNDHDVYTTTDTTFRVTALVDTRPRERPEAKDWHEVTIVLLNGAGERIGESAFTVRFVVDRSTRA